MENAVKAALDFGVKHFDCAWTYLNEKEIGQALQEKLAKDNIKREDLFITGKVSSSSMLAFFLNGMITCFRTFFLRSLLN